MNKLVVAIAVATLAGCARTPRNSKQPFADDAERPDSGARIVVTLIGALRTYGLKRGVASLCTGGGEATARCTGGESSANWVPLLKPAQIGPNADDSLTTRYRIAPTFQSHRSHRSSHR